MKEITLGVVGLGYVGLPLANELAKKYNTVGFDINKAKVNAYINGQDPTNEIGNEIKNSKIKFTNSLKDLEDVNIYFITVPTPINNDKTPNLNPIINATKMIAEIIKPGDIVVYESTVYPGTTEEICLPIIEEISNLKFNKDFSLGYSPERINPGDKEMRLTTIKKIVSASNENALKILEEVYGSIIIAGLHIAPSIKVAEAAKIVENSQRDVNIAFMNEVSMILNKMEIATVDVLDAAKSKWNFLDFTPGLVGGHCIGVDPYYFTYKAKVLGYNSQIINSSRKINDDMVDYISLQILSNLAKAGKNLKEVKILILGITFKENCNDVRNSKIIELINKLKEYNFDITVVDPYVDKTSVKLEHNIDVLDSYEENDIDCIVAAVAHDVFEKQYTLENIKKILKNYEKNIFIDLKQKYSFKDKKDENLIYWAL